MEGTRSDPGAIRGLVFDKDGTLFDFQASWGAWCAGFIGDLAGGDPATTRALARALEYDLDTRLFRRSSPVIAGTSEVIVAAIHAVLPGLDGAWLRHHVLVSSAEAPQVPATPLGPLFDVLDAADLVLGLATNDGEAPARAHLDRAGVLERFAYIAGYDSGHGAKPGPGMLHAFCDATGLPAAACAMIGDSTHDLASGRAAGMVTVAVLTGPAVAEDLAPLADVVLRDISDLPDWLGLEPGRVDPRGPA